MSRDTPICRIAFCGLLCLVVGRGAQGASPPPQGKVPAQSDSRPETVDDALRFYREKLVLVPTDLATRLKLVDLLVEAKRFDEAVDEATRAKTLTPESADLFVRLGRAHAGAQRWDKALEAFGEAVRLRPDDEGPRLELSSLFLARKDLKGAENTLRAGLDVIPPSQSLRAALANVLATQGRHQEADEVVQELLHLAPNNRGYLRTAALYQLRRGEVEKAQKLLRDALALTDTDESARVEALSDLSNFYSVTGQLQPAEEALEESLKLDPNNASTLARLSNVYLLRDDLAKAEPVIRKLVELSPKSATTRVLQARLDLAGGRVAEARTTLEEVVDSAPAAAAGARFFLARAYGMEQRWDKALEGYLAVLAENPSHFFANLDLAKVYLNLRRPAEALGPVERVLKIRPDFVEALRVRAEALLNSGKAQEAEGAFRSLAATASGEERAALELRVGQALEAQNRLAEAAESYERSAREAPSTTEPVLRTMALLDRLGKSEEADQAARAFLARAGESAPFLLTLALREFDSQHLAEARSYLSRATAAGNRSPLGRELDARLLWKEGDLPGARLALETALSLAPDRLSTLALLADLCDAQGKTLDAKQANERILKLDPTNARAANNLAVVLATEPQSLDEALRLAQVALAQAPVNPFVLDTLGWILFRKGDFKQAVSRLEEARRQLPTHAEITYHLGAAWLRVGRPELAGPLLDEALSHGGNAPWVEEARQLSRELSAK